VTSFDTKKLMQFYEAGDELQRVQPPDDIKPTRRWVIN